MESFKIIINGESFTVKLYSLEPREYLVKHTNGRHIIAQHVNGHWVATSHRPTSPPIPVKEIGEAITKYEQE